MNRTQMINGILLLSAALNKEGFTNELEQEQNAQILDEVLQNPFFAKEVANLEKENLIFYGEQGFLPTIKGWKSLQPQTRIVNKFVPKVVDKMTDVELLNTFVESGFAICHRLPSDKLMQKKCMGAYNEVEEVLTCVTNSFNNTFAPAEVVEEVDKVEVKTTKKKAKKEPVEA